jgi:hypothetical protein
MAVLLVGLLLAFFVPLTFPRKVQLPASSFLTGRKFVP